MQACCQLRGIQVRSPRLNRGRRRFQCHAILKGLSDLLLRGGNADTQQTSFGEVSPSAEAWYQAEGLQPAPLEVKDCGIQGKGLVATRRIKKGQMAVQVPGTLVITSEVASRCSSLAPLLQQQQQPALPAWSLLALFLAELRYRGELAHSQRGSGSVGGDGDSDQESVPPGMAKWLPYLEALPASPGTVLEWPKQQVQSLLKGSPLLVKALTIINGVEASYEQMQPLIKRAEQEGFIPAGALSKSSIFWAFGILLSRLVRLSGKGNAEALVPWADFLNHSPQVACYLDWEPNSSGPGAVVLRVDTDYQPGQEVYISYGGKTGGELLLSYGFCPPSDTNPHEAYLLRLGMRADDPLRDVKARALSERGLEADLQEWPLRLEGLPAGVVAWAAFRAAGAPGTTEAEVEALASSLFGEPRGQAPSPITLAAPLPSDDLELLGLQELGAVCGALLKGYPTTLEQDRATAAVRSPDPNQRFGRTREQNAAAIRVAERQILARTQFIASSRAREMRKSGRRK